MANEEQTEMTPAEVADRVWELAKKIDFCMFTTWDGTRQRSRPLSARVFREEDAIYFLVDEAGHKNEQIAQFPVVSLGFADTANHKYVVIGGTARLGNDRAKIKALWSDMDKAWWDSEDDPAIRLLTVTPDEAELWDSPNRLVATATMLFSAVTGAKPKFGDHARVDI